MKQKQHRFMLVVKNATTRSSAEFAVLAAFAKRSPDGCTFHLRRKPPTEPPMRTKG